MRNGNDLNWTLYGFFFYLEIADDISLIIIIIDLLRFMCSLHVEKPPINVHPLHSIQFAFQPGVFFSFFFFSFFFCVLFIGETT